jgi:CDP-diacylglycerol--glycerol-3-phosphate 3-phosphatidyltransferase
LDRLSDMVVFVGLMVFYARDTEFHSTLNVFLAGAGLMGSVMVSYASARAESLIPKCDVGFLRRPERVVLFIIGALSTHPGSTNFFANRMPAVLWVLAVGSYWTFAHRMYHTWRELTIQSLPIADCQLPTDQVKGPAVDSNDERLSEKAKSAIRNRQLEIN